MHNQTQEHGPHGSDKEGACRKNNPNNDMAGTWTCGGILGKIKQLSFYLGGKKSELSIKSLLPKEQLGSFVFIL